MQKSIVLFGGPLDGKRVLWDDVTEIPVSFVVPNFNTEKMVDFIAPVEVAKYHPLSIFSSQEKPTVILVHESMKDEDVMVKAIDGYHPAMEAYDTREARGIAQRLLALLKKTGHDFGDREDRLELLKCRVRMTSWERTQDAGGR